MYRSAKPKGGIKRTDVCTGPAPASGLRHRVPAGRPPAPTHMAPARGLRLKHSTEASSPNFLAHFSLCSIRSFRSRNSWHLGGAMWHLGAKL